MLQKSKYPFDPAGHQALMLFFLYMLLIAVQFFLFVIDIFRERYVVGIVMLITMLVVTGLFYLYFKSLKVQKYALLLFLVMELELTFVVLYNEYIHYSTVYPMLITFILFFFFSLNKALKYVLLHHLYWIMIFIYGYIHYPEHPLLHNVTSLIDMAIAYAFVIVFGFFYYISTESSYRELESSNHQKEILLYEIHHRIKNNLNKMASVLGLQIMNIKTHTTKNITDALLNSKLRIEAMAMVHESIYKQNKFDSIDLLDYITNLTELINRAYGKNVKTKINTGDMVLPLETIMNLGIIINELFTNSIKYAFVDRMGDVISISLHEVDGSYVFTYHENHNQNVDIEKMKHSKTLGMKLLNLTVKELDGTLDISKNSGLKFVISFPK
jgi:two-component sensor histidine kinase